jgi:hypothetical protein
MPRNSYYITSESSEDRLDCADNLTEAIRIAREWIREAETGDAICIEHEGLVIRQLVLTPDGSIEEQEIR